MFFSQNPLSVKFRALQHERLVATRAKPNPDRWCPRWICSFSKPCAQRMNAMQKRSEPLSLYKCHCQHYYYCVYLASFTLKLCVQVKNVYQTSFSAFLDSLDLSRSPDFPQVGGAYCHNTCSTIWLLFSHCFHWFCLPAGWCLCWMFACLTAVGCSLCGSYVFVFTYMVLGKCILRRGIILSASGQYIGENNGDRMLLFANMKTLLKKMFVSQFHDPSKRQMMCIINMSAVC